MVLDSTIYTDYYYIINIQIHPHQLISSMTSVVIWWPLTKRSPKCPGCAHSHLVLDPPLLTTRQLSTDHSPPLSVLLIRYILYYCRKREEGVRRLGGRERVSESWVTFLTIEVCTHCFRRRHVIFIFTGLGQSITIRELQDCVWN